MATGYAAELLSLCHVGKAPLGGGLARSTTLIQVASTRDPRKTFKRLGKRLNAAERLAITGGRDWGTGHISERHDVLNTEVSLNVTKYVPGVVMVMGPRFATFDDLGLQGYRQPHKVSPRSDLHSADLHIAFDHGARLAVEVVCTAIGNAAKKVRHYVWAMQVTPREHWADPRILFVLAGDLTIEPSRDEVTGRAALYSVLAAELASVPDAQLRNDIGERIGLATYRELFPDRRSASTKLFALGGDIWTGPRRWERRSFAAPIPDQTSRRAADAMIRNGRSLASVAPALQKGEQPEIVMLELSRAPELSHHFFAAPRGSRGAVEPKRLHPSMTALAETPPVITDNMIEEWFADAVACGNQPYFTCPIDHADLTPARLIEYHLAAVTGIFEKAEHHRWTRSGNRTLSMRDLVMCALTCRELRGLLVYDALRAVHKRREADELLACLQARLKLNQPIEDLRNSLDLAKVLDQRSRGQLAFWLLDDGELSGRLPVTARWRASGLSAWA